MNCDQPIILVVDDETHILHVVSLKLLNAGYKVITAEDGEEGLQAAVRHRPRLVITDFQMPYRSGLELCQELKRREETSDIPCLLLTARGFSLSPQLLSETNIAAVISKPFSLREIIARVEALVGAAPKREASDAA